MPVSRVHTADEPDAVLVWSDLESKTGLRGPPLGHECFHMRMGAH